MNEMNEKKKSNETSRALVQHPHKKMQHKNDTHEIAVVGFI